MNYIAGPHHGPGSLDSKLEGPSIAILDILFNMVQPLDDFQGLLDFHGHIS